MKRFTILLSVMLITGFTCTDLSASKKRKATDDYPTQDKNKIPKKEKESATAALRNSASQRKPKQLEQSVSIVPTTSSSSSSSSSLLHSHLLPGGFSGQASTSSSSSSSTLSSSFELPTLKKIKKETKINIDHFPKHDKDEKKEIDPNMLSPLVGDLDKASHDFNMDVFGKDPALTEAIIHSLQDQDAKVSSSSSSQVDLYGRTEGPSSSSSSLSSATQNFLVETDGKTHEVKVVAQQNSLLILMPDELLREIFLTSVGQSLDKMIMTLENLSLVNKTFCKLVRNIIEQDLHLDGIPSFPIQHITIAGIMENGDVSQIIHIILGLINDNTIKLCQAHESAHRGGQQNQNTLEILENKILDLIKNNEGEYDTQKITKLYEIIIPNGFLNTYDLIVKKVPQEQQPNFDFEHAKKFFTQACENQSIEGVLMLLHLPLLDLILTPQVTHELTKDVLFQAVVRNNIPLAQWLLKTDITRNLINNDFLEAFEFALMYNRQAFIDFFLENQYTQDFLINHNGMYLTIVAAIKRNMITVLQQLLDSPLMSMVRQNGRPIMPDEYIRFCFKHHIISINLLEDDNLTKMVSLFLTHPKTRNILTIANLQNALELINDWIKYGTWSYDFDTLKKLLSEEIERKKNS